MTSGAAVDSGHSIQGAGSVPGAVTDGATVGVAGKDVLLNGATVELGHSLQIVDVSGEVVVLHGMVTDDSDGDELVISGLLATAGFLDKFKPREYTLRSHNSPCVNAPKAKARTMLQLIFILFSILLVEQESELGARRRMNERSYR